LTKVLRWVVIVAFTVLLVEFPHRLILLSPGSSVPTSHYFFFHWADYKANLTDLWHRVVTFAPGLSSIDGRPIVQDVLTSFASTLPLLLIGLVFSIIVGVLKGVYDGLHSDSKSIGAVVSNGVHWLTESLPDMFLIFSLELFGFYLNRHGLKVFFIGSHDFLTGTVVPALVLSLVPAMYVARVVRRVIEEQFGQQYLVTAQAKGLSRGRIIFRHMLPNTIPSFLQALVPTIGMLLANLVLVEYLFYRQGVIQGLLNAMDYSHYVGPSFPYGTSGVEYSFQPFLFLSYLVGGLMLFLVCMLVTKAGLQLLFRRHGTVSPYSDALRYRASNHRFPWQLTTGFSILGLLMLLGMLYHQLHLPNPDKWQTVQIQSGGQLSMPPFPPSASHLLGTDTFGRDLLSGAVQAILPSLAYVGVTTLIIVGISLLLALLSSVWRIPGLRTLVQTWNTLFTVIPGVIAALLILEIPDVYWYGAHVIPNDDIYWASSHKLIFLGVIAFLELGRASHFFQSHLDDLENKSFMEAAEVSGNTKATRLFIHHLRPFLSSISEYIVIQFSRVLLLIVTLGFFGNSIALEFYHDDHGWLTLPAAHDWGGVISQDARDFLGVPWVFFAPVLFVTVTLIALNLILTGIRKLTHTMPTRRGQSKRFSVLGVISAFKAPKAPNQNPQHVAHTRPQIHRP
jgi:ABC-type dipeptide/oligopeptide/nickel transport system permease subunit